MSRITLACPHCGNRFETPAELPEDAVECPSCKGCMTLSQPVSKPEGVQPGTQDEAPELPSGQAIEVKWYFAVRGERVGPLNLSQTQELAAQEHIDLSTLAWRKGMADWQILGQFPELAEVVRPFTAAEESASGSLPMSAGEEVDPSGAADHSHDPAPSNVTCAPRGPQESGPPRTGPLWPALLGEFILLIVILGIFFAAYTLPGRTHGRSPALKPAIPAPGKSVVPNDQTGLTGLWEQPQTAGQAHWQVMFAPGPLEPLFEIQGSGITISGTYSRNEDLRPWQIDLLVLRVKRDSLWAGINKPVLLNGVYEIENDQLTLALDLSPMEAFKRYAESFENLILMSEGKAQKHGTEAEAALRLIEQKPRPRALAQAPGTDLLVLKRNPRFENPYFPGTPKAKRETLDEMVYPPAPETVSVTWEAEDTRGVLHLPGNVDMPFIWVQPGTFTLGIEGGHHAEAAHRVTLTKGYWLGQYEVNQAQWKALMEVNPSNVQGDTLPVESVSWEDAILFIKRLNLGGAAHFRLPTEAEWVYACQAGNPVPGQFIEPAFAVENFAWCAGNSASQPHPCGQKQPNAWGFHDMTGNLWEWCSDWFAPEYYANSPETDPQGPDSGAERITLGGSWRDDPAHCCVLKRNYFPPNLRRDGYGFRLCAD